MKSEFVKIEEANIARRLIALIMDAVLTVFIFLGLCVLVTTPIANKAFGYADTQASQLRYQIGSQLYIVYETDDSGKVKEKSIQALNYKIPDDYKIALLYEYEPESKTKEQILDFYKTRIKHYYCEYRPGYAHFKPEGFKNETDFRPPNYKEYQKQKSHEQWENWFETKVWSKVKSISDAKTKASEALNDFYYQDYYQSGNKKLENIQLFIILPSYVLSFSIFFIIIPLCFKNGETLGKKTLHIGLLAKDGYSVKKRQIVLRQSALLLYCGLFSFVIGIGFTSIATLFLGVFIYFVATVISPTKRSFFDYLSFTIVVDTRKSVWYQDEFQEVVITNEFNENMKKYRKGPVENKNVIQVGSKIVNEDIKKEVEESKKSNKE